MSYTVLNGGVAYVTGEAFGYRDAVLIQSNLEDHEDRLVDHESRLDVVEAGSGATLLTADPASPANDTFWVMRDGASPQAVKLRVRIGGVSYTLAEITI